MAAVAVLEPPVATDHPLKIEPGRAAQMARIGHELGALQVFGKDLFTKGDGLLLIGLVQAVGLPDFFRAFDDEGGGLVVELVDMGLEPAVLGALKQKGKGVVELVRAQPNVAVGPHHDVGLEDLGIVAAHLGIDAVAGDHQIGIGKVQVAVHLGLEDQLDIELLAARLQNIEQLLAPYAHKAVATGADHAVLEVQLDVVPVVEGLLDGVGRGPVPGAHVVHGGIRKHHAPAKGIVRLVALDHGDVVAGVELLHQQRKIQPRRPATDANDLHARSLARGARQPLRAEGPESGNSLGLN